MVSLAIPLPSEILRLVDQARHDGLRLRVPLRRFVTLRTTVARGAYEGSADDSCQCHGRALRVDLHLLRARNRKRRRDAGTSWKVFACRVRRTAVVVHRAAPEFLRSSTTRGRGWCCGCGRRKTRHVVQSNYERSLPLCERRALPRVAPRGRDAGCYNFPHELDDSDRRTS